MSTARTPAYLIVNRQLAPALQPSVRLILDITSSQRFFPPSAPHHFHARQRKIPAVPIHFIHNF